MDDSVTNTSYMPIEEMPGFTLCIHNPYLKEKIESVSSQDNFISAADATTIDKIYQLDFNLSTIGIGDEPTISTMRIKKFVNFFNGSFAIGIVNDTLIDETLFGMVKCFTLPSKGLQKVKSITLTFEYYQMEGKSNRISAYFNQDKKLFSLDAKNIFGTILRFPEETLLAEIKISDMKIFKGRSSKFSRCYDEHDYDKELRKRVMEEQGCWMPFWESYDHLSPCKNLTVFNDLLTLKLDSSSVWSIRNDWILPCQLQRVDFSKTASVGAKKSTITGPGNVTYSRIRLTFLIDFDIEFYTVFEQGKSYSVINFLAELAGYAGLMLGVSALQISDVLIFLMTKTERLVTKI